MNWTEFLTGIDHPITLAAPAAASDIESAAARLGHAIPDDLADLLRESNGVLGKYSLGLVWPVERIVHDNLEFRSHPEFPSLYMPFDPLLFFADAGNGDQFAFAVLQGAVPRQDIFVWDHETDSRQWVAPSLRVYLERWCSGELKI